MGNVRYNSEEAEQKIRPTRKRTRENMNKNKKNTQDKAEPADVHVSYPGVVSVPILRVLRNYAHI